MGAKAVSWGLEHLPNLEALESAPKGGEGIVDNIAAKVPNTLLKVSNPESMSEWHPGRILLHLYRKDRSKRHRTRWMLL